VSSVKEKFGIAQCVLTVISSIDAIKRLAAADPMQTSEGDDLTLEYYVCMLTQPKKLLAATIPESLQHLQDLYGQHFSLICVTCLDDALSMLDQGVDAVLCNVHFDEGALFDLLRITKTHRTARSIPFFVIDASSTTTSPAITQSISIASKALGADQVIHIAQWRKEMGDREAFAKALNVVLEYVERDTF
jgi:hypothetical protein